MHLDFTIDLETLALTPNAAILQLGCVAWNRTNDSDPFCMLDVADKEMPPVSYCQQNIDLRSCVEYDLDFDQQTVDWWHRRPSITKENVLCGECCRVDEALSRFLEWVSAMMRSCKADSLCLWSQGSDFDISILRNVAHKCGLDKEFEGVFSHTTFRDARTYILEMGRLACLPASDDASSPSAAPLKNARKIYDAIPECEHLSSDPGMVHTALHDAVRTSWQVWCIMKQLSLLFNS